MLKPLRKRYKIEGSIRDSGFGIFVIKAAESLGVAGFIKDNDGSVIIEAEGTNLNRFMKKILDAPLPSVVINRISEEYIPAIGETIFRITGNDTLLETEGFFQGVDTAICKQCSAELQDTASRRFKYPFISCPECGKKFSSFKAFPPERENTIYSNFEMCKQCRFEYNDPLDRRFHHHRISCPECGPKIWLAEAGNAVEKWKTPDRRLSFTETLSSIKGLLLSGQIICLNFRNAYNLVCAAEDVKSIKRINQWRRHNAENYYILFKNIQKCNEFFELSEFEKDVIYEGGRPVVFLQLRGKKFSEGFQKDSRNKIGAAIAQTGFETILTDDDLPLAVFLGTAEGEAGEVRAEYAVRNFKDIADYFVFSETRPKLSMKPTFIRTEQGKKNILNLGIGYSPLIMELPFHSEKKILCTGGDVNNSFCFLKGSEALVSHQTGNLKYFNSYKAFEKGIFRYFKLNNFIPDIIVTDIQPEYIADKWAEKQRKPIRRVQHHTAHAAACLAENKHYEKAVVIVFDGGGYGSDGALWGGEFFSGSLSTGLKRQGHLKYFDVLMNSEEKIDAWSFSLSLLKIIYGEEVRNKAPKSFLQTLDSEELDIVETSLNSKFNLQRTSSAGRFIKAISSMALPRKIEGISHSIEFAMTIEEKMLNEKEILAPPEYDYKIEKQPVSILNLDGIIEGTSKDIISGRSVSTVSWRFYHSFSWAAAEMGIYMAMKNGTNVIGLSGGTFQSPALLEMIGIILQSRGINVLFHKQLPFGDGNLCFGQAALAGISLQKSLQVLK